RGDRTHLNRHSFPTRRSSDLSWEMNGPAFFRSRRALESLKNERRVFTRVDTGDDVFDRLANALLALVDTVQSGWTDAQWEAVTRSEEHTSELQSRENLVCRLL